MSLSQLIHLFIVLGLISYSYELNVQSYSNNLLRHRRRGADVAEQAEHVAEETVDDVQELIHTVTQKIKEDKEALEGICKQVSLAASRMQAAGSQDVACAGHWKTVQSSLSQGIKIIIKIYQRYIKLHKRISDSIEDFASSMIGNYQAELSAMEHMTAPHESEDMNSDSWKGFGSRFTQMLNHAGLHEQTLPIAADCAGDLVSHTVRLRQLVLSAPPVTQTRIIRIIQSTGSQYRSQNVGIPCHDDADDNGNQACSCAIAGHTRNSAVEACGGCIPTISAFPLIRTYRK